MRGLATINTAILRKKVKESGLKKYLIAQNVGIDRSTFRRWLSGQLKRAKMENLTSLAECLNCHVEDLVLTSEFDASPTKEIQRAAAQLLCENDLFSLLLPSKNFELFRALTKACFNPDLTFDLKSSLLKQIALAYYFEGDLKLANYYAEEAFHLSETTRREENILGSDLLNAVICLERGNIREARVIVTHVLGNSRDLAQDELWLMGVALLGQIYFYTGAFNEAFIMYAATLYYAGLNREKGLAPWQQLMAAYAWLQMARIFLQNEEYDVSRFCANQGQIMAQTAGYAEGQLIAETILQRILGHQHPAMALEHLQELIPKLASASHMADAAFEQVLMALTESEQYFKDEAVNVLNQALKTFADFPLKQGRILLCGHNLLTRFQDHSRAKELLTQSIKIYRGKPVFLKNILLTFNQGTG